MTPPAQSPTQSPAANPNTGTVSGGVEPLTVRAVTFEDLVVGAQVLVLHQRAGQPTLDRAEIVRVDERNVFAREHRRRTEGRDPVGVKRLASVRTVYGIETNVTLYGSSAALDADFPPERDEEAYVLDRNRALERQTEPGVYVADPDGEMTAEVTGDWGSQAYVSLLVPGIAPEELTEALSQVLADRFPGHRVTKLQARPAADRRVNVYRLDYEAAARQTLSEPPRTLLAWNVLEAEATAIGGHGCLVEQVDPTAPQPIIGT